jgi:hypothetical protein
MTAEVFDDGTIYTYQGDTILFTTSGVPTDSNYNVYWSVRELNSDVDVIDQVPCYVSEGVATVHVTPQITDLIPVPEGKKFKDYRHSLKACDPVNGTEHTLQIGNNDVGVETKLRVFRKQSEGIQ